MGTTASGTRRLARAGVIAGLVLLPAAGWYVHRYSFHRSPQPLPPVVWRVTAGHQSDTGQASFPATPALPRCMLRDGRATFVWVRCPNWFDAWGNLFPLRGPVTVWEIPTDSIDPAVVRFRRDGAAAILGGYTGPAAAHHHDNWRDWVGARCAARSVD